MPFPQFWTACFFLMLLFLSVDSHVRFYVANADWWLSKATKVWFASLMPPQFVSVECLITSVSDLFPKLFRKPRNHEIFALVVCLCFFIVHLMLVTEVNISLSPLKLLSTCCLLQQTGVVFQVLFTCFDCCLPLQRRRQRSEHIKVKNTWKNYTPVCCRIKGRNKVKISIKVAFSLSYRGLNISSLIHLCLSDCREGFTFSSSLIIMASPELVIISWFYLSVWLWPGFLVRKAIIHFIFVGSPVSYHSAFDILYHISKL